jgi:pilus assembly protein Flp/PilA
MKGSETMVALLRHLVSDEEGATMVEYALMVALIGASLVTVVTTLKTSINTKLTSVSTTISGS